MSESSRLCISLAVYRGNIPRVRKGMGGGGGRFYNIHNYIRPSIRSSVKGVAQSQLTRLQCSVISVAFGVIKDWTEENRAYLLAANRVLVYRLLWAVLSKVVARSARLKSVHPNIRLRSQ